MPKTSRKKAEDALFRYIRVKECIETTGHWFTGVCITCGRRFHINALDAGHYVSGRRNAVLFEQDNIHIQCKHWCNLFLHGNPNKYREFMVKRYGEKKVKEIKALKHKVIQDKDMDFEGIEKKYTEKLKELERKHGFRFKDKQYE